MAKDPSSESDYGFFSRLLHHIALEHRFIAETTFDIEQTLHPAPKNWQPQSPVFITGLARSGTTTLLDELYQSGKFVSLTYQDMPFVFMPVSWKKLSGGARKNHESKERAHGDGVMVNPESPEAFEEVFWRIFCGSDYIQPDQLSPHTPSGDSIKKFRQFIYSVLKSQGVDTDNRYLSKNNNNILRLPGLKKSFPNASIIVPFRDPLQQSISLLSQHKLFSRRQDEDPFSLKYMNWLGHHEFGQGHIPFVFPGSDALSTLQPLSIDYWLTLWKNVYGYILDTAPEGCYFLCYEDLCANSQNVTKQLYDFVDIAGDQGTRDPVFRPAKTKTIENASTSLINECEAIYLELQKSGHKNP